RGDICRFSKLLKISQVLTTSDLSSNVTLDPDTAHPKLILSEDLKSCWLGRKSQNLINDDKRFDLMTCVLGREMFITGRHYWDVAVENEGDWGVGVARSSVKRKGIEAFRNMEGIWAMAKCCGRFWVYMNPPALVSDPMRWKIKKIRVSLNYAGGRVAFCDVERGNLLYAFSGTSFLGEPIHPFFWIGKKTRLSSLPSLDLWGLFLSIRFPLSVFFLSISSSSTKYLE
uniref:B30.2/SPRY domain-containing protein n=1 Tax=Laticauda laticaudata TaxID=8630 RepID=A0A8C5SQG3_LATLA